MRYRLKGKQEIHVLYGKTQSKNAIPRMVSCSDTLLDPQSLSFLFCVYYWCLWWVKIYVSVPKGYFCSTTQSCESSQVVFVMFSGTCPCSLAWLKLLLNWLPVALPTQALLSVTWSLSFPFTQMILCGSPKDWNKMKYQGWKKTRASCRQTIEGWWTQWARCSRAEYFCVFTCRPASPLTLVSLSPATKVTPATE